MTAKNIVYWTSTSILSLAMLASGAAYLTGAMNEDMAHLGYPAHFIVVLGTWKLLVAPALLAPGFALVKQWAYAGLFFTLTGAAVAHIAAGDGVGEIAPPLVMLGFALASLTLHRAVRFSSSDADVSAPHTVSA